MSPRLAGKRITLCVTGSVAAYKAVLLTRLLIGEGAQVEVLMTRSASEFVGAQTFAGLTGKPVHGEMFGATPGGELHVELAARSDAFLVVPATADFLARLASGRADDLATATALCACCPMLCAPAMHPSMWAHPATQRNVAALGSDGVRLLGPVLGMVASGDHGIGRMLEPGDILEQVVFTLTRRDLEGRHLVVSAGPTVEDLDPVRFVGNRSSGRMGFAVAARAAARGARVTLITGPVELPTPPGITRVDVRGALAMRDALWDALGGDLAAADALVMAAAVGDYRPAVRADHKLKRDERELTLTLVPNPDLLAEIGACRRSAMPVLVGFAVETGSDEEIERYALDKLRRKKVDLVVANHASESFGRDRNRATLVGTHGVQRLPDVPKTELADVILDEVGKRLAPAAR